MIPKLQEKEKAISLRRQGFSYSEILKRIPVSKSSLSLWLRSVGLSKKQRQRLTQKKLLSIKKGWEARKNQRIQITDFIKKEAKKEIGEISKREAWLIGAILYWAEGSKQKKHNISQGLAFTNSDPFMIKLFINWLKDTLKITDEDIKLELYIHENFRDNFRGAIKYWSDMLNQPINKFKYIYFKSNKVNTKRKNIGGSYNGLIRIRVSKSTNLNRKITGWIEGICENCRIV